MPSFIVPMAIWFLMLILGLTAVTQALVDVFAPSMMHRYFLRNASLLLPFLVGGHWAGWFFQRKSGRSSTWTEAWTSGAMLAFVFIASIWLWAIAFAVAELEIGLGKRAWSTGSMSGLFYSLCLYPLVWIGLSSMLHSASKTLQPNR